MLGAVHKAVPVVSHGPFFLVPSWPERRARRPNPDCKAVPASIHARSGEQDRCRPGARSRARRGLLAPPKRSGRATGATRELQPSRCPGARVRPRG
jgi:hypothetical protein